MPGSGLHFTAYSTWPGNASTNARVFDSTVAGRRQCIGTSGRSVATSSSTDGSGAGAGKRRRRGETAERRRSVFMAGSSQLLARDVARPAAETGGRAIAARKPLRRHTQPMLRVLRIAANRSANIGGSLTTPAPRLDRIDRKGRVTSLLCPKGFQRGARGTCDASSNRLTQGAKRERGYRDYGDRADMRTSMVSQARAA